MVPKVLSLVSFAHLPFWLLANTGGTPVLLSVKLPPGRLPLTLAASPTPRTAAFGRWSQRAGKGGFYFQSKDLLGKHFPFYHLKQSVSCLHLTFPLP